VSTLLTSSVAPLVFSFCMLVIWYFRCKHKGWPRRRIEYVWTFVDSSVAYVMVAILIGHNVYDMPFSDIFAHNFGEIQINLAFLGALFEALWALWDMWSGEGIAPMPH
jgi:hypothetical protein